MLIIANIFYFVELLILEIRIGARGVFNDICLKTIVIGGIDANHWRRSEMLLSSNDFDLGDGILPSANSRE